MKTVRLLLVALLVTPALVVLGATQALACSCVPPSPDHKAIEDAAAVFTGTMVEADVAKIGLSPGKWTFEVDTVYKGRTVSERQVVHSHTQSAACGIVFKEGKRYAVFAHEQKGGLGTNLCMNTRLLPEGKDLKLRPIADFQSDPHAPRPDGEDVTDEGISPLWIAAAIGAVGLVAGALRWWWFARRPGAPGTPEGPPS